MCNIPHTVHHTVDFIDISGSNSKVSFSWLCCGIVVNVFPITEVHHGQQYLLVTDDKVHVVLIMSNSIHFQTKMLTFRCKSFTWIIKSKIVLSCILFSKGSMHF